MEHGTKALGHAHPTQQKVATRPDDEDDSTAAQPAEVGSDDAPDGEAGGVNSTAPSVSGGTLIKRGETYVHERHVKARRGGFARKAWHLR